MRISQRKFISIGSILDEQQAKVAANASSRDGNLAPITEDEEPATNPITDHGPDGLQTGQEEDEVKKTKKR